VRALQREAPAPNEPSERPCLFEEDEADFLVGLFDRRLLALKCVVSDSKEAAPPGGRAGGKEVGGAL